MNGGDDDLLGRADALIRRQRMAMASAFGGEADDVPVLTQVVAAVAPAAGSAGTIPPDRLGSQARELLFERLPGQRQALAEELAAWLDAELPRIVMRVMDGVTDQMIARVTEEARSILQPRLQAALEAESRQTPEAGRETPPV